MAARHRICQVAALESYAISLSLGERKRLGKFSRYA